MAIYRFNGLKIRRARHQYTVVYRNGHLANDRQAGVLQQVVNVVNPTGAGVVNRYHSIVSLSGFDLIKDIGKFCAAAFNKLFKMAGSVLTCCEMGI